MEPLCESGALRLRAEGRKEGASKLRGAGCINLWRGALRQRAPPRPPTPAVPRPPSPAPFPSPTSSPSDSRPWAALPSPPLHLAAVATIRLITLLTTFPVSGPIVYGISELFKQPTVAVCLACPTSPSSLSSLLSPAVCLPYFPQQVVSSALRRARNGKQNTGCSDWHA